MFFSSVAVDENGDAICAAEGDAELERETIAREVAHMELARTVSRRDLNRAMEEQEQKLNAQLEKMARQVESLLAKRGRS